MAPPDEYTMWQERERTRNNSEELEKSYSLLMNRVKGVDPLTIAETVDGLYSGKGVPKVIIPFLHSWFVLDLLPYRLRAEHAAIDTLTLKVLVLHHIIAAAENQGTAVRVMGVWIDTRSLQNGAVLGAHFARTTSEVLSRYFALDSNERVSRALRWGGKPVDLGDQGFVFKFFPRLPVAFIHWEADDEFAAFSKVLFDVSASNFMPTHALAALTEFLIYRLAEG